MRTGIFESKNQISIRPGSHVSSDRQINVSIDTHVKNMSQPSGTNIRSCRAPNLRMRNVTQFKLLDLYCGEGLAAWGYWLSGRFSEIVGVDINPKMRNRYSFDFIQGSALDLDYEFLSQFDFIHASPPCQGYSKATPEAYRSNHPRLIAATHLMLHASGKNYVIENVEGSGRELKPNIVLNGNAVGLPIDRRRYFHSSTLEKPIRKIMRNQVTHNLHDQATRAEVIEGMGLGIINPNALKKMTKSGMLQGIPPAMTKQISTWLLPHKVVFS